jgi:hypothetical protein
MKIVQQHLYCEGATAGDVTHPLAIVEALSHSPRFLYQLFTALHGQGASQLMNELPMKPSVGPEERTCTI